MWQTKLSYITWCRFQIDLLQMQLSAWVRKQRTWVWVCDILKSVCKVFQCCFFFSVQSIQIFVSIKFEREMLVRIKIKRNNCAREFCDIQFYSSYIIIIFGRDFVGRCVATSENKRLTYVCHLEFDAFSFFPFRVILLLVQFFLRSNLCVCEWVIEREKKKISLYLQIIL